MSSSYLRSSSSSSFYELVKIHSRSVTTFYSIDMQLEKIAKVGDGGEALKGRYTLVGRGKLFKSIQ